MKNRLAASLGLALFGPLACFPQSPIPLNQVPTRIVGHPQAEQNTIASGSPNLVEGREFWAPQGIALDTSVTPPILYVSDTGNNRVLAWKNASSFNNGQQADLVIGQPDFYHTSALGPGTTFSTGLSSPTGLTVDSNGNLYIADQGNNRILRFPKPFAAQTPLPDLYIGQPNLTSKAANAPNGQVTAQGLNLKGSPFPVNLAFDGSGNLWVADAGNRRVLRFAGADVAAGGGPLQANLEVGQLDFTSVQPAVTGSTRTTANAFAYPTALGFDSSGRLYVGDADTGGAVNGVSRVLVFAPPFSNGAAAVRMMGVFPANQLATSQDQVDKTLISVPAGFLFFSGKMGVLNAGFSRILLFDSYEKWPASTTMFSPTATGVIGQIDYHSTYPNGSTNANWIPTAGRGTFSQPFALAYSGSDLFVADTGNHRVVVLPQSGTTFGPATGLLGQDRFDMMEPNLIEGREFDFLGTGSADAGVALDTTGDTPHLYVADPYNNRVLGFQDFRQLKAGKPADIVIGQRPGDFNSGLCNLNGDPDHPTQSSLCIPTGVLVDASGNLYVADTGNGRVLRFPAPFAHSGAQQADLVLGQQNFTTKITDPTPSTMSQPYGLAFAGGNGLLVSDINHNRVLFFSFTGNGTFNALTDNGRAATKVLGQPDFFTTSSGSGDEKLNSPRHIACDSEARPYVADSGNNRVQIFDQIMNNADRGARAVLSLPVSAPHGVFVNQLTGEAWVTDYSNGQVKKYPKFQSLLFNPAYTASVQAASSTLAVTQDQFGDLIVADASNRVGFYYPGVQAINGANFMPNRKLAPGMFASLCAPGSNCATGTEIFGGTTAKYSDLPQPVPMPTALGDMQVLFNGKQAPLYYVSPSQINFYVPMGTPSTGDMEVLVVQASTGRIYAAGTATMNTVSPAIITLDFNQKFRQAAVINQDGTINSPTNPAARGSIISIYATGQGFVPNAPADGTPPTDGAATTQYTPQVLINSCFVGDCPTDSGDPPRDKWIEYSGLAPGFVGVWQINVHIPKLTGPGNQIPIAVVVNSLGSTDPTTGYITTIAVK